MKLSFLVPKQPIFFELFAKLGQEVLNMACLLDELSRADNSQVNGFVKRAVDIEHSADNIAHEIVKQLNLTFVTPFDREDIYNLADNLDDIVDLIENVVHNLAIYQTDPRQKLLADFSRIILADGKAVLTLTEMLKTQKYSDDFKALILKIHFLEDDGDRVYLDFMKALFEKETDPIAIIKLKSLAGELEDVVDKFQKVSNVLENILVKSQ